MKKSLSILLFFSAFNLYAIELRTQDIFIPKDAKGVEDDTKASAGNGYHYKVESFKSPKGQVIMPKLSKSVFTIKALLGNLFYAYQKEDKELLLTYFDKKTRKEIGNKKSGYFDTQFAILKNIKKPLVHSVYKYKAGYLVSWSDKSFFNRRMLFIKKTQGFYQVSKFHADSKDLRFNNLNLYFAADEFKTYPATIKDKFGEITNTEKKKISFELKTAGNYIQMFKADSDKILVVIKDNYKRGDSPLLDKSEKLKHIEIELSGKHFSNLGQNEIFYVESSYPLNRINSDSLKKSKKLKILKK